jgi:hypothetical protein
LYKAYSGDSLLSDVYNNYEVAVNIDTTKSYSFKLVAIDGSGNKSATATAYYTGITAVDALQDNAPVVFSSGHTISIRNLSGIAQVEIFNLLGEKVFSTPLNSDRADILTPTSGLYIVQIKTTDKKVISHKVLTY